MNKNFIFKALVGSHIYGLNTETSDRDYYVYTVNEVQKYLFEGLNKKSKAISTEEEDIVKVDILKLYTHILKINPNTLNSLFSPEIEINPFYKEEVEELLSMKEEIARYNTSRLFQSTYGAHKQFINWYTKTKQGKFAAHAAVMMNTLRKYSANGFTDYQNCLTNLDEPEFITLLKNMKADKIRPAYGFGVESKLTDSEYDKYVLMSDEEKESIGSMFDSREVDTELLEKVKDIFMRIINKRTE